MIAVSANNCDYVIVTGLQVCPPTLHPFPQLFEHLFDGNTLISTDTSMAVSDSVNDKEDEQIQPTHRDAGTQWEDQSVSDHTYAKNITLLHQNLPMCDRGTQCVAPTSLYTCLLRNNQLCVL